jgi:hypothetical protein
MFIRDGIPDSRLYQPEGFNYRDAKKYSKELSKMQKCKKSELAFYKQIFQAKFCGLPGTRNLDFDNFRNEP